MTDPDFHAVKPQLLECSTGPYCHGCAGHEYDGKVVIGRRPGIKAAVCLGSVGKEVLGAGAAVGKEGLGVGRVVEVVKVLREHAALGSGK